MQIPGKGVCRAEEEKLFLLEASPSPEVAAAPAWERASLAELRRSDQASRGRELKGRESMDRGLQALVLLVRVLPARVLLVRVLPVPASLGQATRGPAAEPWSWYCRHV